MIYLIGDAIDDTYVYGEYTRISPESPIPVFLENSIEQKDGGALNVYNNLVALGSEPYNNYSKNSFKTRYVVDNRIVFRSDEENYIINEITNFDVQGVDWIVISDYNKGFIHHSQKIIDNCKAQGAKIIVDPKKPLHFYTGVDIVKLNKKEFFDYTGYKDFDSCNIVRRNLNISAIVITLGSDGVYINSEEYTGTISGVKHQVADVTGAGDVFLAAMTHYLDKGHSLKNSCDRANDLAAISVTKMGTYVLQPEDLKQAKTIFTNGCFDIIHKGHIEYLQKSKKLGGKLIVGLNSDKSVKKLKGFCNRPVNNQFDRREVLQSIGCVDQVIIFDEDTPYELIKQIKPDIITKGGDYKKEQVVGNDLAEVQIIEYHEGYSTTNLLNTWKQTVANESVNRILVEP